MSEQNEVECGMCGREGGSFVACGRCHGRAHNVPRQYTLSEIRSGRAPKEDRYGHDGGLEPRRADLPGTEPR